MASLRSSSVSHSTTLRRLISCIRFTEDGGQQGKILTGYEDLDRLLPIEILMAREDFALLTAILGEAIQLYEPLERR